jgi:hypothetical protein
MNPKTSLGATQHEQTSRAHAVGRAAGQRCHVGRRGVGDLGGVEHRCPGGPAARRRGIKACGLQEALNQDHERVVAKRCPVGISVGERCAVEPHGEGQRPGIPVIGGHERAVGPEPDHVLAGTGAGCWPVRKVRRRNTGCSLRRPIARVVNASRFAALVRAVLARQRCQMRNMFRICRPLLLARLHAAQRPAVGRIPLPPR